MISVKYGVFAQPGSMMQLFMAIGLGSMSLSWLDMLVSGRLEERTAFLEVIVMEDIELLCLGDVLPPTGGAVRRDIWGMLLLLCIGVCHRNPSRDMSCTLVP